MIKSSIEQIAHSIGYDIGHSDDHTQSDLLNGFCKGILNSIGEERMGGQICYIVDKIDPRCYKVLKEIVGFIELKEKK